MKLIVFLMGITAGQIIIQPLTDSRTHDFFVHKSGMKVFITADASAPECAVALRVDVGHLSDPREWAGMANLVMRSLFEGSEEHLLASKLATMLDKHQGSKQSSLEADATSFIFDIQCEQLQNAFEVFAPLFIAPTFKEKDVQNVLSAIEKEFKTPSPGEWGRHLQLLASLANPDSAYSRLSEGNAQTLSKPGLLKAVLDFFNKHYKPGRYTLSVYGQEVAKTKSFVRKYLSALRADGEVALDYNSKIFFRPTDLNKLVRMKSLREESKMHVIIFFNKNEARLNMKPLLFLTHLLESSYPGSFVSTANQKGWLKELFISTKTLANTYSEFSVFMELTSLGMQRHADVRKLLFATVEFMATNMKEYLYADYKAERAVEFQYNGVLGPWMTVTNIISNSASHPPEKVLVAPYDLGAYSKSEFIGVLQKITPANAIVLLSSKNFMGPFPLQDMYGTKYSIEPIEAATMYDFAYMRLPPQALFPLSLKLLAAKTVSEKKLVAAPHPLLKDITPKGHGHQARLWHYRDVSFGLPFFAFTLDLYIDDQSLRGAKATAAHAIIAHMMKKRITQMQYVLDTIHASAFFSPSHRGFQLHLKGVSPALLETTKAIFEFLQGFFDISPENAEFELHRIKLLKNGEKARHSRQFCYAQRLWESVAYKGESSEDDRQTAFSEMTFTAFKEYFTNFSHKMFADMLISGNVSADEAVSAFKNGVDILKKHLTAQMRPIEFILSNINNSAIILLPHNGNSSTTSSVVVYYHLGLVAETKTFAATLSAIISDRFYAYLLAKNKVGCRGKVNYFDAGGYQLFYFELKMALTPVAQDVKLILDFVSDEVENLKKLTPAEYQTYQKSVAARYVQPLTSIDSQHEYLHSLIIRDFDNSTNKGKVIRQSEELSLDKLRQQYQKLFVEEPQRLTLIATAKEKREKPTKE